MICVHLEFAVFVSFQLVAVYEILKDDQRRQQYNDILVNGLPDWRTPVYYYRLSNFDILDFRFKIWSFD